MRKITFLKTIPLLMGLFFLVTNIQGQILVENFEYAVGSLLVNNGWTAHSGSGTESITVTNGLSYSGFAGSEIGGAALLDNNGEDVHKTYDPQSTGTVYVAFMVNVTATSAGYFLHLAGNPISTIFRGKVFMDATNHFGVSFGVNTATLASAAYNLGTTYFLVLKYEVVSGTNNDIVSLFIFDGTFPDAEPATPTIGPLTDATQSDIVPSSVALRQFNAAQNITVDGIRIASNWDDAATPSGGPASVATPSFSPAPGLVTGPFDLTILCNTEDADIYYTTDGSDPDQTSELFENPIPISATTTVKARAYYTGLNPSAIATGTFSFPETVSTIAELRNGTSGTVYYLTGTVVLTFQQDFRGQKYIQDATAAILIDDNAGVITSDYEIGDGIAGLSGTVSEYGNMLQFVPAADPGDPVSAGNIVELQTVNIAQLFANFEEYESELVKIDNASFDDAGATFANGMVYVFSDASDAQGNFRTTFYDVDYIETPIPSGSGSIVGLCNSRSDGDYITSRAMSDFEFTVSEPSNYPSNFLATATGLNINVQWTDATGAVIPTGYLILASDQDNIVVPNDGIPVPNDEILGDGSGAMNIQKGVEEYLFTELSMNTTYFFKVFPYCGSGNNIDFKTDGTPPQSQATITSIPEPTNYPTTFAAAASGQSITLTWTDATGDVLPTGYLIKANDANNITLPVDGTPVDNDTDLGDGTGAMNVLAGVGNYTFSGLNATTTYYFIIFSYTNSGALIDYKTDGTPPQAEATTGGSSVVDVLVTTFDESWENWQQVSITGDQAWDRNNTYGIGGSPCAKMSGYSGSPFENEDWLISPAINLTDYSNEKLNFNSALGYEGPALAVKISSDFNGTGNLNDFTWTDLSGEATWPVEGTFFEWTNSGDIDIAPYSAGTVYIAFVFTSTATESATWEVDNITVMAEEGAGVGENGSQQMVNIYPNPGHGIFNITIEKPVSKIEVYSTNGSLVLEQPVNGQLFNLNLTHLEKGLYFLKCSDESSGNYSSVKIIIN